MIASAKFEMDRAYFEAMLREAVRSSGWFDRWKFPIACFTIVLGMLFLICTHAFVALGAVLVAIGLFELVQFVLRRAFWIGGRLKAREQLKSHTVELQFFEDGFTQSGPTSSGRVLWKGVHKVRETENALQVSLGDGMSIYVPKASIQPPGSAGEIVRASKRGP